MNRKIVQQQLISCGCARSVNIGRRRPRGIRPHRLSQAYHDGIGGFEQDEGRFLLGILFFGVVSLRPREILRY